MKHVNFFSVMFILISRFYIAPVFGNTLIVDKWGPGPYKTIPSGITAASAGDTVVVYPGEYTEQVILNKNILLQGSGYEYTRIRVNADPALSVSAGTVRWFSISSQTGDGVRISGTGGVVENCVVVGCSNHGVSYQGTSGDVINCVILDNAAPDGNQISALSATTDGLTVINTIIWSCLQQDRWRDNIGFYDYYPVSVLYCRTKNAQGVGGISDDPLFVSCPEDVKLSALSPCINKGKSDISDPDCTISDMGYFGGTDTPIFPVVTKLWITVNPDGSVKVQGTAESRY
jgi:hypothetical protein